jgi:hypothetical protein
MDVFQGAKKAQIWIPKDSLFWLSRRVGARFAYNEFPFAAIEYTALF